MVDRALTRGRVAKHVADEGLLDLVVAHARVTESLLSRLEGELRIIRRPGLLKLRHAHADDAHFAEVFHERFLSSDEDPLT